MTCSLCNADSEELKQRICRTCIFARRLNEKPFGCVCIQIVGDNEICSFHGTHGRRFGRTGDQAWDNAKKDYV
jgi:hypothetical protein